MLVSMVKNIVRDVYKRQEMIAYEQEKLAKAEQKAEKLLHEDEISMFDKLIFLVFRNRQI